MTERAPTKHNPPEFVGEVVVGTEGIDRNGHLNNASYLSLYGEQRGRYMETLGINTQTFRTRLGLSPFMTDFSGHFRHEVLAGQHISIHTSAEITRAHILFRQRMVREGLEVGDFQCAIYMVGQDRKVKRLPNEIIEKINQANFTNPPQAS